MAPPLRSGIVGKGALELGAIVREYLFNAPREHGFDQRREACGVLAVVAGYRDRQDKAPRQNNWGKAAGVVGGREQVAAGAAR